MKLPEVFSNFLNNGKSMNESVWEVKTRYILADKRKTTYLIFIQNNKNNIFKALCYE